MENIKDTIIEQFYVSHFRVKDIAETLGVSSAYITKIIKSDIRYSQEKEFRKNKSKIKRKIDQNNFIKNKRDAKTAEDNYLILQNQHNQDVKELSGSRHLTNENYRKWNYSAYKYDPSKHRYEFDSTLGRSYDVPKYIKER